MLKVLHVLGLILVIAGAINWGLVGIFQLDVIALVCSDSVLAARIVYTVIGLAGLMLAATTITVYSDWHAPVFPRRYT
jgi:uncharacterized membrane protein YuzA (DUF378 family)